MNRHYSPAAAANEAQNEKCDSVCPAMSHPLSGVCRPMGTGRFLQKANQVIG
jgi:hypothetical protein